LLCVTPLVLGEQMLVCCLRSLKVKGLALTNLGADED